MRPINLSNFTNKILSKIVASRLNSYLPSLISENQTIFISGRLITKNVTLTREIVHNMSRNKKKENLVIKLDMEKVYDRVSWVFLYVVLKKMGFNDIFIDIIRRLMEDNWKYTGFTMAMKGPQINHLAYADNVVVFTS
ncbi:uncharacterized protein LOC132044534 [Lycium ferocissimum]|uniref:uncharacterized protein LOC132044534 n=1 Tax=Lycium ferocissimum TaxID=112874 RepID=UPI0028157398|nr:uncharacterized protein LOC132044534 [Lycium ferocissimum]